MPDQDAALTDALLRCRAPRTKDELWWYCKLRLRVVCEVCKGAKQYWEQDKFVPCPQCGGRGVHGFHIARNAVCTGHAAPLDALWEIYSGQLRTALWVAVRGGGKTRLDAILEHLLARFKRYTITHMGGSDNQAQRCRSHFRSQTDGDPEVLFGFDGGTREPAPQGVPGWLPELSRNTPEKVEFSNRAAIEFLPGTMKQASGPHAEMSVLDEVDETTPEVEGKFSSTAFGPRSIYLLTSTHTYATGTVSAIRKEKPGIPLKIWCLFEIMRRCEHDCADVPLPEGRRGRCPFFEIEEVSEDGRLQMRTLCGGVLARKADGHLSFEEAVDKWLRVNPYWRKVEWLCQAPEMGMGAGIAYWAYSPANDLDHDPEVDPAAPLEWTMDFNPGAGMRMCSLIIQQHGPREFWIVDEIVLQTANTPAVVAEFQRRYGPGGNRWKRDVPFPGGLWVFGDRSGHTPASATVDTDYQLITRTFRGWPGYHLSILPQEANPPIVSRMNVVNAGLWSPLAGERILRVAPHCVNTRDELARLPCKPGTREKDKSDRIQRLGLTHLSDCLDYWAWKRLRPLLDMTKLEGTVSSGGQRATAGRGGEFRQQAAGKRAVLGSPWSGSGRGSLFDDDRR